MERKRIFVLANSRKTGGRCIAGREVVARDDQTSFGPWIRPVSNHGDGELSWDESCLADGSQVSLSGYVELCLAEPVGNPCQPENWRIAVGQRWVAVTNCYGLPSLAALQEYPQDLWHEPGYRSDRISHQRLVSHPPSQSLYLIRPSSLRIRLFTDSRDYRIRQAVFVYNGVEYDLPVTDPVIYNRYAGRIPNRGAPPMEERLPCGDACFLCVSLADDFHGYHYKVVATIFKSAP